MEDQVNDWIIEDGVEIPKEKSRTREQVNRGKISPLGRALKSLEVGQSLFTDKYHRELVRRAVDSRKRRNPQNYVTREMDGGIRIWRVE